MKSLSIINKYILGIGATLLVLLALAIGVTFSAITADAQSNKCKVTASLPNVGKQIKDRKFALKGGRAYITVGVHGDKCKSADVTVASWKAPSANGRPYSQQTFFKSTTKTFKKGHHLISVDVPTCYFQVDLIHGKNPTPHGTTGPDYGKLFIAGAIAGNKPCKKPVAACEGLNVQKLSRTQFTVSAQASAKHGAKIKGYVFTIKKGNLVVTTKKIMTSKRNVQFSYTQSLPGTYTASVVVKTSEGKKRSPNCTENFTVTKRPTPLPGTVDVCDPQTGEIINVPEEDAGNYLPIGSPECEDVSVCDPSTGEIISAPKKDEGNYEPTDSDACKEGGIGSTPEELPTTGPTDALAQLVGVASLVGSTAYYAASRRALGL